MAYKRVLVMQDISCVGQCSMTVALPILSACGHETCILPTAVLSTHTGGFGKPKITHLDASLEGMWKHWQKNGITFDAILVGYLGSEGAVDVAQAVMEQLLAPGGITIVDPAMADHGKRYSGLTEAYAQKLEALCRRADIILPNVTEAAMFAGMEYRENLDREYTKALLDAIRHPCVILTGVGYRAGETGILVYENGRETHIPHQRRKQNFHGTGDMFAAAFTGALLQGKTSVESARIASHFVLQSIRNTLENPAHWYGVKFETALPELMAMVQANC